MNERASRTKVAALILQAVVRDGLPYPGEVHFRDDLDAVFLDYLSIAEVRLWAPVVGAEINDETDHPTVPGVFVTADTPYKQRWNGWRVTLRGHDKDRNCGDIPADVHDVIDEAVAR